MRQIHFLRWEKHIWRYALLVLVFGNVLFSTAFANEQSLAEQLSQRYRVSRATLTANGALATEQGQVYQLRRGGLVAFAGADRAKEEICPATFRNGTLHIENGVLCVSGQRKVLRVATSVCITAITASRENDTVSFYLIECGKRGAVVNAYYAKLVFGFPKRALATQSIARVEQSVAEVLATSGKAVAPPPEAALSTKPQETPVPSGEAEKQTPSPVQPQKLPAASGGNAEAASPPVEQPLREKSQSPLLGLTAEQVTAIRGAPELIGEQGDRLVWIYPDGTRVVFAGGKVSEVKQPETQE